MIGPSLDHHDLRRRKRLAKVTVRLGLAVRGEILEVDRPRRPPHRLARVLVERDDVLMIAAVEVHQQQVAEQDRRRTRTAKVVALEVAALPDHLARLGIDRGGPWRSERHIHAPGLDDRCRGRIRVERMRELRRRDLEELQVEQNLARVAVERHGKELAAILGRGRHPDLAAQDHGRRPRTPVDGRLPADVLPLPPCQRQIDARRIPRPVRTAKLRPLSAAAAGSRGGWRGAKESVGVFTEALGRG